MAVTAIVDNGQILETAAQSSVKKAASKNGMDKDAFLQLLVAQMNLYDSINRKWPDCRKHFGRIYSACKREEKQFYGR